MRILINGETREVAGEMNLRELLEKLDLPTERIAVEVNKDVVRKKDWESVKISDEDKIEIVHFVGGG
jgi:sulfur carrier protein